MKKLVVFVIALMFVLSLAYAGDFTYVGVKKCKGCHKGEKKGKVFETWSSKKHAKAFESVKSKGEEKNPKCLGCHTTAFNKGGYKIDDPTAVNFEGVQCESCHGPGSVYKKMKLMKDRTLALQNGLVDIKEETCTVCHDGSCSAAKHAKKFNYQEALKQIAHTYRNK